MSEINGIPVVNQVFVEDKGYSVPFITNLDGELFILQLMRNRGDDGYKPYYVRIGSVLKEYLKASVKEEPTQVEIENNVSPYQRGYVDGYKRGRENGVNEGRILVEEDEYVRGLKDAWKCARKIVMQEPDGGMSYEALEEVFGTRYFATIFKENDACNAISKIEKYESKVEASVAIFKRQEEEK